MKLNEYIKKQEGWARELRRMAKEARENVEVSNTHASTATDPVVQRQHEANAKRRVSFAARFDHMASEVDAEIERLRMVDGSDRSVGG